MTTTATSTFYDHFSDVPDGIWRWPNFSPAEIAREMGVSRGTVYKAKAQMSSRGKIIERETS